MTKRSVDGEPTKRRRPTWHKPSRSIKKTLVKHRPAKRKKPVAKKPAKKPAKEPVKRKPSPAKKPAKKPAGKPAKKSVKKPAKKSVAKKPAKKPVKKPVKKPAGKPVKKRKKPVARKPTVKRKPSPAKKPVKRKPSRREYRPSDDQSEAITVITARLESAQAELTEYLVTVKVHPLPSGPIDGELLVQSTDTSGVETFQAMMDAFGEHPVNGRAWGLYWIALGLNYYLAPSETAYRRWRGLDQVVTNYQKANRANILEEILIVLHSIIPGMQQKRDLGVHSVFVRLHWSADGKQPKR